MKVIRGSNRLFFINLLCLLWLPNYCDIKENEADIPAVQISQVVSSISSEIENVPSNQEKEKHDEIIGIPVDKLFVEPNVEYVNSVERNKIETNSDVINVQLVEEATQQVIANLESSRPKVNDIKVETPVLQKNPEKSSDGPIFKIIGTPSIPHPEVIIKPSLSAPHSQTPTVQSEESQKPATTVQEEQPVLEEPPRQPVRIPMIPVPDNKPVVDAIHPQPHYDGMPSFDEWKKMMLAEQEKGGQKVPSPTPPGKKISSQKRRRNYSSYECGAKIVASNGESEGTGRILNELVDEYMLNPCKAKIWFVIELCETVQATQIELANFELFSSCPREFAVYSSDNFPTRDWVQLGTFTAAEQRVLQSFELKQEGFGKFIKIELLSYYGKEHYCPLSVVRIFGTSMVDEYEEMETLASQPPVSEDDLDRLDISMEDKKSPNLFNSATDAVINIVKKAAQALGQHQSSDDGNNTISEQQNASQVKLCKTVDNSSNNKCEDIPIESSNEENLLPLDHHNMSVSPSSMHHSIFRLLQRCDQCVSNRIRYHSSAQPHCRFFQAAFGPVLMKHLCQWLKEHPLMFAHESSAHRKDVEPLADDLVVSPTKSPPPQILIIPMDNDTELKKPQDVANVTSSVDVLESEDVANATLDVVVVPESKVESQLEPSISLHEPEQSITVNDSQKVVPEFTNVVLPSSDAINHLPRRSIIVVSEGTNMSADNIEVEAVPPDNDPAPTTESVADTDEEQFIPESVVLGEDLSLPSEDLSLQKPTEAPDVRNVAEGKPVSVPPPTSVSEPVPTNVLDHVPVKVSTGSMVPTTSEPVPVSVSTAGQKESVFMRMSNRIKALELNMSLSSQYLQELSQRYRRQMEDMQRAFNRTIGTLNDTAKKTAERDLQQQEAIHTLQLQVANLTQTVGILLNERSSVFREMIETHVCLMVVEAIIMITVMSLCVRRLSSRHPPPAGQSQPHPARVVSPSRLSKRRSSADATPPVARKVKRRSVSEEALHSGEEKLLAIEAPMEFLEPIRAKKKNRKRSRVLRSISNPSAPQRSSSPSPQQQHQQLSHSDSCMLKNDRSKPQLHNGRKNHPCENCSSNSVCNSNREHKRRVGNGTSPLQNLTNGRVPGSRESPPRSLGGKPAERKFSFRKFLRFQKRDSI